MDASDLERRVRINRLLWIVLYFSVAVVFVFLEWQSEDMTVTGWFLAAGVWSAICGIGYSLSDWFVHDRSAEHNVVLSSEQQSENKTDS